MTDGGEGILNLQHTDEAKLKISIAAKKRYKLKPQCRKGQRFANKNSRKVVIVDLKTYIIYKYSTLVDASLFLSTSPSRVRRACIVGKSINNCYLKFGDTISKEEIKQLKNKKIYDLSTVNINKDYSCIQKKVINLETKKVYSSISEVCRKYNLKNSTLSRQLNGVSKNKTIFKLI
jgi:hypothetical protein